MGAIHVFTLAGVPVFISMWYLLLLAFFAMNAGTLVGAVLIVLCVTASLLVHEFGHAVVARRLGLGPQVLLHGWGGLTAHAPAEKNRDDALIIAAGPSAGLLLALAVYALREVLLQVAPGMMWVGQGVNATLSVAHITLTLLVDINILWSLLNLVPLWPLDGGQLFRLGLLKVRGPEQADRLVHQVGIGLAGVGIAYALTAGWIFLAIVAGLLGWENFQRLDLTRAARGAAGPKRGAAKEFATLLLADAEAALQMEDWREAARLAHQLRDQAALSERFRDRALEIIVVANAAQGEFQEALDFGKHAPDTPAVREALAKAEQALREAGPEPSKA